MSRVVAAVSFDEALNPEALPSTVAYVETLSPLRIALVVGEESSVEALTSLREVTGISVVEADKLAIVRGIAGVLGRFSELEATTLNGYGGRLPEPGVPSYPILAENTEKHLVDFDPEIRRITAQCFPTALNLSIEQKPWLGEILEEDDVLAAATRAASRTMTVVVPVGNAGRRLAADTRSAVAKLPWTLAVGATMDPEGTRLDPRSGKGPAGGDGPFVCAFGTSKHREPRTGTSFAAPRVSRELLVLTGFLLTLYALAEDEVRVGVPLCGLGFVDEGMPPPTPDVLPIPAYPIGAGIDAGRLNDALASLRDLGVQLEPPPSLDVAVCALARSARPIPGYRRNEVGHGFVNEETTLEYLTRFDGTELAELHGAQLGDGSRQPVLRRALTDGQLDRAVATWVRGAVRVYWDYDSGRYRVE